MFSCWGLASTNNDFLRFFILFLLVQSVILKLVAETVFFFLLCATRIPLQRKHNRRCAVFYVKKKNTRHIINNGLLIIRQDKTDDNYMNLTFKSLLIEFIEVIVLWGLAEVTGVGEITLFVDFYVNGCWASSPE